MKIIKSNKLANGRRSDPIWIIKTTNKNMIRPHRPAQWELPCSIQNTPLDKVMHTTLTPNLPAECC